MHKWILPATWKFAAVNFLGDTDYNPSHRSVAMIGIGLSPQRNVEGQRDNDYVSGQYVWTNFPAGHGMHSLLARENPKCGSSSQ